MTLDDDYDRLSDEEFEDSCGSNRADANIPPTSDDEDTGDSIIGKIEASRTELLDLSLRNPLLNYRTLKSRGVEVVDEIPSAVFGILVNKARPMSFLPHRDDDKQVSLDLTTISDEDQDDELGQPKEDDSSPDGLAPRYTDNRLHTNESASQLQSRLLKTHHAVNTLIQEQGVNTLFIALGMVEWYASDTSDITRRAPLVLVPVKITRSDVRGRFYISYTFEELGANLSFIEKVRNDFGIEIPGLPNDEDLDIDGYFAEVSTRIEDLDRWSVDRRSVVLGFFSFGKFLMYRDLEPDTWPEGTGYGPRESSIIRGLFGGGFAEPDPEIQEEDHLDDHLNPEDIHHVVDADSSQALAIFDVNQGRNLVIQGPPGTGKSQTIMNIIAEAVGNGRTVLFISEKMAALEVVKRRMDAIGLGVACLELHSHKTTKRAVLDELKKTLELGPLSVDGIEDDFRKLASVQSRLNKYAKAVNSSVGDTGVTPYRAYGELIRIRDLERGGSPLQRVELAGIDSWSGADFDSKLEVVSKLQTRLARVGVPKSHLFWGSRRRMLLPSDQAALEERIDRAVESLEILERNIRGLTDALGLNQPEGATQTQALISVAERAAEVPNIQGVDLSGFEQHSQRDAMKLLVNVGNSWVKLHSDYDDILEPSAWGADARKTRDTLSTVGRKFQSRVYPQFYISPNNPSIPQEWIDTALGSLEAQTEAAHKLSDALGLSPPENAAQTRELMRIAKHAADAPDITRLQGVGLSAFETHSRRDTMKRLVDAGNSWVRLHSRYDDILEQSAWYADVREAHDTLSTVGRKFWRFLSPRYRRAQKNLAEMCLTARPESTQGQIDIVDTILQEQEHRRTFERLSTTAGATLGPKWQGEDSDWEAISRIVEWALTLFRDVDNGVIALDAVRSLRDDMDASQLRDLLVQVKTSSEFHAERVAKLYAVIDMGIEGSTTEFLSLRYIEQRDILAKLSKENIELSQANVYLSNLCRAEPPRRVERQMEVVDAILQEQEHRRTFERLSTTAGATLGPKWQGEDSDWEVVDRIVAWVLALFRDVDGGVIPLGVVRSLRDDMDAVQVSGLLGQVRVALDSHSKCLKALQSFLEIDDSRRFKSSTSISLDDRGEVGLEGLEALSFVEQGDILMDWSKGIESIHDLVGFNSAADVAEAEGLVPVVKLGEEWPEAVHHLRSVLDRAWYEYILSRALRERPALRDFAGNIHEELIGQFCSMDELALDHNRSRVAHSHWAGLPKHNAGGQLRTLRREFEKKRKHLPIRRLMAEAGNAIQAIKPVFMMSPMSIATYLPPGSVDFDLVVFDEASQVRPVDALGALMRADQSVVVGDSRQLPPTRFFDAVTQSDDDQDGSVVADMESILGLFRAQGAPGRMLRWHYRSRHESLIAVSNREFYENGLVVFPSPDSSRENIGLRYHYLPDTQYDRGRSSTNRKEAARVAMHVMEHARYSPELTLGVTAFSSAQREAIQDELERLRRQDPSCETFFNDHPEEPFFVKNLENIQGDERDVIFISIGYGRDASGQVAMNFGPLTADGGERRLNVLITRAKLRCDVFTNLRAADIDLNRTSSRGVRALKTFLAYAETGILEDAVGESGREIDSPFQKAVAAELRSLGYDIHEEVATGGKFIDLAVVDSQHPGRYILGIECDGASYHSSRWARDRDRLREQHLRNLNWRLYRIWSTDWFRNPERELNRAVEAIEQAKVAEPGSHPLQQRDRCQIERFDNEEVTNDLVAQRYELARPSIDTHYIIYEPHEIPLSLLLNPIIQVVRVEGPVHVGEVQRRIADAVGVARIGHRIKQNLNWAIDNTVRRRAVVRKDDFLWSTDMDVPVVRDRKDLQGKSIEMVALEEIAQALKVIVKHSYGIDRKEAATETARLLGFRNVSKNTGNRICHVMDKLIGNGDLMAVGAQVIIANEPGQE
ncbi:MAG: DUF3320 domain-containing protein [Truepera sp.]|nr:DUF3320 domain-containing protein [Truepera sp.]